MRRFALVVGLAVVAAASFGATARADVDPARVDEARAQVLTEDYQSTLPSDDDGAATGSDHFRLGGLGGGDGDADGDGGEHGGDGHHGDGDDNDHDGEHGAGSNGHGRPHYGRIVGHDEHGRPIIVDERGRRYIDTREYEGPKAGAMSDMFAMIAWGVLIVGIAFLLFWFGSELLKYGGDEAAIAQDEVAPPAPDLAVIERPLGDAEELARRGEFREAIHTLLLRTLQELARTSSVRLAPAMTSREILARVPVLADARDALSGLITAVELTHFGDDEATEADYLRCRAQFQVFAAAFRSTGLGPGTGMAARA